MWSWRDLFVFGSNPNVGSGEAFCTPQPSSTIVKPKQSPLTSFSFLIGRVRVVFGGHGAEELNLGCQITQRDNNPHCHFSIFVFISFYLPPPSCLEHVHVLFIFPLFILNSALIALEHQQAWREGLLSKQEERGKYARVVPKSRTACVRLCWPNELKSTVYLLSFNLPPLLLLFFFPFPFLIIIIFNLPFRIFPHWILRDAFSTPFARNGCCWMATLSIKIACATSHCVLLYTSES